jgi:hypothetical protein
MAQTRMKIAAGGTLAALGALGAVTLSERPTPTASAPQSQAASVAAVAPPVAPAVIRAAPVPVATPVVWRTTSAAVTPMAKRKPPLRTRSSGHRRRG